MEDSDLIRIQLHLDFNQGLLRCTLLLLVLPISELYRPCRLFLFLFLLLPLPLPLLLLLLLLLPVLYDYTFSDLGLYWFRSWAWIPQIPYVLSLEKNTHWVPEYIDPSSS
ncbi:hypothetical protein BCR39DRAFT_553995 [Naematelia encephala]|uniref:Uncharacterized protein n=1 Tax=Naematelia encephala TaxID=71784 RepID=A0A1Y2AG38_9TREE|nr:hypothetical protein BCR39DRAFT_553995 [Naematelia encephala]